METLARPPTHDCCHQHRASCWWLFHLRNLERAPYWSADLPGCLEHFMSWPAQQLPQGWWGGFQKRLEGFITDYVTISQKIFRGRESGNKNRVSIIIKMRAESHLIWIFGEIQPYSVPQAGKAGHMSWPNATHARWEMVPTYPSKLVSAANSTGVSRAEHSKQA